MDSIPGIAKALGISEFEVFGRAIGSWPTINDQVEFAQWLEAIRSLSQDEREEMLAFMRAKININIQRCVYKSDPK